jgi:hypothetical protein
MLAPVHGNFPLRVTAADRSTAAGSTAYRPTSGSVYSRAVRDGTRSSLLRLSATASWQAIASAAAIVVIRKLATLGITAARRARTQPASA